MSRVLARWLVVGLLVTTSLALVAVFIARNSVRTALAAPRLAPIDVRYPAEGSLFPPDIAAPTFLWHDPDPSATAWRIEVTFGDRSPGIHAKSDGPRIAIGEIDEMCVKTGAEPPVLEPDIAESRTWKPDEQTWETIKQRSVERTATVTIIGFKTPDMSRPVSTGKVTIKTSKEPVGAPVFYRDVPLISVSGADKGVIMPLPSGALPLISWKLRYVNESKSRLVMHGLPTCANCHSVSRDGKTLGLDVDGPGNDKGLYGLVAVHKQTFIRNEDVIRWQSFSEERSAQRFGVMSQVSPDGAYVITSTNPPGVRERNMEKRLYITSYRDYGFSQVFYPTRGVLAWYSRDTRRLQRLPGADDPKYVHAGAFWSPDGKYLVFSRAEARDPYPPGRKASQYANDPNETQIQYDLYRIPFNGGNGGVAEPIAGASGNGMSNNFPKVSPDGKWIVFVQNRSGLLMRPDSRLFIVPFGGR